MSKKLAFAVLAAFSAVAFADINVGVSVSATGPAASLGIPEKNTFSLLPTTIAGHPQFRGLCPASAKCMRKMLA